MTSLVFLEHHDRSLTKASLGVLSKAATLGGDVAGVVVGSGVRDAAPQAGAFGAQRVFVWDDERVAPPLPQPRVDAIAHLVRDQGFENVLFGSSVLAADVAAGLNWDLVDLASQDGELVGKRPALQDSVVVDVGWTAMPRLALFRSGSFDPVEK